MAAGGDGVEGDGVVVVWGEATDGKKRQSARIKVFIMLNSKTQKQIQSAR